MARVKPIPKVVVSEHASKHEDSSLIRSCLDNQGGATQIWMGFGKDVFYLLCQLKDGRWGIQSITQGLDKLWYEKTAFVPKDGTFQKVIDYLTRSGTRFNGPYPWE